MAKQKKELTESKKKKKAILFTSQDGAKIKDGDIVYGVEISPFLDPKVHIILARASDKTEEWWPRRIFFKSRKLADNYIAWNLPKLSALEVYEIASVNVSGKDILDVGLLLELAKTKIK